MKKQFQNRVLMTASLMLFASTAWAHAKLESASPAQNAVVSEAPAKVTLKFNEDIEAKLSKVEVKSVGSGKAVGSGKPTLAAGTTNTLEFALPGNLSEGKYQVFWKATSTDTHRAQGQYEFTVKKK